MVSFKIISNKQQKIDEDEINPKKKRKVNLTNSLNFDEELVPSNTGNVFKHIIIRSTFSIILKKMLQNSIFDKYFPYLDEEIEVRGNSKSLNFKLMIDPSINLESIKKLGNHDVVVVSSPFHLRIQLE